MNLGFIGTGKIASSIIYGNIKSKLKINNRESFNNVETWINDYLKTTKIHNKQPYRTFMIVGNKIDNLNRMRNVVLKKTLRELLICF